MDSGTTNQPLHVAATLWNMATPSSHNLLKNIFSHVHQLLASNKNSFICNVITDYIKINFITFKIYVAAKVNIITYLSYDM